MCACDYRRSVVSPNSGVGTPLSRHGYFTNKAFDTKRYHRHGIRDPLTSSTLYICTKQRGHTTATENWARDHKQSAYKVSKNNHNNHESNYTDSILATLREWRLTFSPVLYNLPTSLLQAVHSFQLPFSSPVWHNSHQSFFYGSRIAGTCCVFCFFTGLMIRLQHDLRASRIPCSVIYARTDHTL